MAARNTECSRYSAGAARQEGAPITRQHGGPVRVVLPKLYFWKSPKWVTRIELLREDRPGFWEVRGYHKELPQRLSGDLLVEELLAAAL